uniref:Uncharacterized protein n=1 Tax=Anguilla anguilla TaxID=7936 RepID=A0A0E9QN19_ANGAN
MPVGCFFFTTGENMMLLF